MSFDLNYHAPENTNWQGRFDAPPDSTFFQCVRLWDLHDARPDVNTICFVLIGFACDEGVARNLGRQGAVEGPNALRSALAKYALHRLDVAILDAGNIVCTHQDLEAAQSALAHALHTILQASCVPIVIGGGHEMAWGHYQGIAKHYPNNKLGIINLDAHLDMRPLLSQNKGSSGSPFLQIAQAHVQTGNRFDYLCVGVQPAGNTNALLQTAKQYNVDMAYSEDVFLRYESIAPKIKKIIDKNNSIYLSICLDVMSASCAPGVSAPQPLGIMPWHVVPIIRQVAQSGKAVSYDIAELSPPFDSDNRTAKLAAQFVYEIVHSHKINGNCSRL